MRKQIKRIVSIVCAIAMVVTGLSFMPQSAKAADTWFNAKFDTPETNPPTPWYHHHTSAVTEDDEAGIWDYTGPGGATAKYLNGEKVQGFAWNLTKANNEANWLETDNLMDVACVKKDGEWVKPTPGMSYKLNMTIDYTNNSNGDTQLQIWNTNGYDGEIEHKDVEANYTFNPRKGNIQWSCEDVDVFIMPGNEFKVHLGIGVSDSYAYNYKITAGCTFTISKFELVPDGEYEVVPFNDNSFQPSADVGGQTVYAPWTLLASYVPSATGGSYGVMLYNVDPAEAENIEGTTMKLASTVGEPEKDDQGHRITDPSDRFWWVSASLLDYAEEVGLDETQEEYSGTINLNSSKATDEDCYLYVYVDNTEYQFALSAGDNQLKIPKFIYGGGKDIKFLFDELPKNSVITVNSISFEQETDDWTPVPNTDPDGEPVFEQAGLFTLNAMFSTKYSLYGKMKYKVKENPTKLDDTTIKVTSTSGFHDAWSVSASLKNYCEQVVVDGQKGLASGDKYMPTIKVKSNKKTVEDKHGNMQTVMVVISGKKYEFPLTAEPGEENVFTATEEQAFKYNSAKPNVDFELDCVQKDTELTITEVSFEDVDKGWTKVPNEQVVSTGKWALFARTGTTVEEGQWGALSYKTEENPESMADTQIKVRSSSGWHDAWATLAMLPNYLNQGKEGTNLEVGRTYKPVITYTSNKATGIDDFGDPKTVLLSVDNTNIEFMLEAATNKTITLDPFTYKNQKPEKPNDVVFNFDKVEEGTILCIKSLTFEPVDDGDDWTQVPNEQTVNTGKWQLFARTGTTVEEGQWGALSYKTKDNPTSLADTQIKVRSSSGWHDAWATLAMLPNYLDDHNLEVGRTYKPVITYSSTKATGVDDSGDPKTVLLSVDNSNIEFPLEVTEDKTITLDPFTYENQKPDRPNDVVFNLDQVEPDTVLCIKSLSFEPVDDGWTPVPNRKYTAVTNDGMELYARMGETVEEGSWGKTSYKYDEGYNKDTASYKNLTIKTRSTSGWYVANNPASLVYFNNFAGTHNMTEGRRYKISFTLEADRTDEVKKDDDTGYGQKNFIKIIVDGTKEFEIEEPLPDGQEVTVTTATEATPYFVYEGRSPNVSLVLDKFTAGATLRIKKITVEQDPSDREWIAVPNNAVTQVGKWQLYANFDAETESWSKMFYSNSKEEPTEMGDTTMYCYSTSGWFGARSIRAILSRYTKGKLINGQEYSAHITIESDKNCNGLDDNGNEKGIEVTIDNNPYVIPIYKGKYEYVIPMIKPYSGTGGAADNVQFNFDTLTPTTIVNISDVSFEDYVESVPEISAVDATVKANRQVEITWEQTKDVIYGTASNKGGFEIYVDGKRIKTVTGNVRSITTGILAEGPHDIKVVATLGSQKSNGKTTSVVIQGETTSQFPTETQTQAPTTVEPTTEAPTPETTTEAPTEAPTPETTTEAPTEAPTTTPSGETIIEEGKCGDDVSYILRYDGTLIINGRGRMYDYDTSNLSPFSSSVHSIKRCIIGDAVTNIGEYVFYNCKDLEEIIISDNVDSIEKGAFDGCTGLTSIVMPCSVKIADESSFNDVKNIEELTLTEGLGEMTDYTEENYTKTPWYISRKKLTTVNIEEGVESIGDYGLYGLTRLEELILPESMYELGAYSLSKCTGLEKIVVPKNVQVIDENAFRYNLGMVMSVEKDSYAERFAKEYGIAYQIIGEETTTGEAPTSAAPTTVAPTSTEPTSTNPETTTSKSEVVTTKQQNNSSVGIKVGKVTGLKVKNKKRRKVIVSWRKLNGVKKYQVKYSMKKSFKKSKTKIVTKNKVTIKKLKKKKRYYFKVRGVLNGIYGAWSSVKKLKIVR